MSWRAAVDIGSVSAKILLTDGVDRVRLGVDTLLGGSRLTSGGETRGEVFSAEALRRLEGALVEFRGLVERHRPVDLRVLTTAPGRWVDDPGPVAALVARHLGVTLEVVDGATEAELSYRGVRSDPALVGPAPTPTSPTSPTSVAGAAGDGPARVVTVDIGGGSTELAAGWSPDRPDQVFSIPVGGRSLTAAYLHGDPPRAEELSAALSIVELHLDDVRREQPRMVEDLGSAVVVGVGAVVTLAAIEVGLDGVDPNRGDGDGPLHGFVLRREAAEDVFRTIATEARVDRVHNPGLPAGRVDEIVGAGAVLVEVMRQLGLDQLVVSQRGLLDGILDGWPGRLA